jgi:two-component system OmpR family response regulator
LTRKEFAVLQLLMSHPNAVLSRRFLLDQAWGYCVNQRSNLVEVYIRYLRIKIDKPFGCQTLQTVRGAGYRLCSEDRATLASDRRAIGSAGDGLR